MASSLDRCIAADRAVLEAMPREVRFGLHLCRGNHRSSGVFGDSLEAVAERMFRELPYDTFLIEWDETEREGDYSPLRFVPPGPIVALGLISSKRPELESEAELLDRLEECGRHLDVEQLAITPQCGFASTMEGNLLTEEDQWRKLELVGRVADRVWAR